MHRVDVPVGWVEGNRSLTPVRTPYLASVPHSPPWCQSTRLPSNSPKKHVCFCFYLTSCSLGRTSLFVSSCVCANRTYTPYSTEHVGMIHVINRKPETKRRHKSSRGVCTAVGSSSATPVEQVLAGPRTAPSARLLSRSKVTVEVCIFRRRPLCVYTEKSVKVKDVSNVHVVHFVLVHLEADSYQ